MLSRYVEDIKILLKIEIKKRSVKFSLKKNRLRSRG